MIKDIVVGDITSPDNPADIIIAMNTTMEDLTELAKRFAKRLPAVEEPFELGSVLSFRFDQSRNIHMLICHRIGFGGWESADKYVRFGLDYLWNMDNEVNETPERKYSIVKIGTGPIGLRDGADSVAIRTAIDTSYLPVTMWIRDPELGYAVTKTIEPRYVYRTWSPTVGQEDLLRQ